MDTWDKSKREERDHNQRRRVRRENPSFSSILLDAIYRSIDETNGEEGEEQLILYRETMKRKQIKTEEEEILNFRRACMIDKWMEKKKVRDDNRRNSMADFDRKARNVRDRHFTTTVNSSSSSSDSCCTAGRFSSSESSEFFTRAALQRPKPIRTTSAWSRFDQSGWGNANEKPNQGNGLITKTKSSKASKLYEDLKKKKVKHPISPGGRLASFLNSIFNGGSPKSNKHKFSSSNSITNTATTTVTANATTTYDDNDDVSSRNNTSKCSSASSFSRSCLSKTASSSSRGNAAAKRSVRFCPISVIVDEDCQPCGHKNLFNDNNEESSNNNNNVLEKGLSNNNLKKNYGKFEKGHRLHQELVKLNGDFEEEEEEEEDDRVSCSSSDLFELDNLSVTGIQRYKEELPVYETTHFNTNRAIANGLVL